MLQTRQTFTPSTSLNIKVIDLTEIQRAGLAGIARDLLESYRNDPNVELVEPNYLYHTEEVPNDPRQNQQWAWGVIDAYEA